MRGGKLLLLSNRINRILQAFTGREFNGFAGGDLDLSPGSWVATGAGWFLDDTEAAKANQTHFTALSQSVADGGQYSVYSLRGLGFGDFKIVGDRRR
jgi:hypothetical protein